MMMLAEGGWRYQPCAGRYSGQRIANSNARDLVKEIIAHQLRKGPQKVCNDTFDQPSAVLISRWESWPCMHDAQVYTR